MPLSADKKQMPVEEVVALSKDHGYLAKQLYVVFTSPTNGLGPVFENIKVHLEHQEKLEREGIMFLAGPNWTDDEKYWEGEGMFVIRAKSLAEAKAIAESDPMHKCGARKFRVRPWMINEGSINVRLTCATGKFELT
jgi:uncharacterized protein YciI